MGDGRNVGDEAATDCFVVRPVGVEASMDASPCVEIPIDGPECGFVIASDNKLCLFV